MLNMLHCGYFISNKSKEKKTTPHLINTVFNSAFITFSAKFTAVIFDFKVFYSKSLHYTKELRVVWSEQK